jgi:hypothetical protein
MRERKSLTFDLTTEKIETSVDSIRVPILISLHYSHIDSQVRTVVSLSLTVKSIVKFLD